MRNWLFFIILILCISSCETASDPEPEQIVSFTGRANKGPFLIGSEVIIVELDKHLRPTGKTFFTEILDNDGSFEVDGIKLKSDFIEVRVNGFFYDEVMRTVTENKLTLTSVVEISDGAVSNVNILTHLERKRVAALMGEGLTFIQAKRQSFQELMDVFGFDVPEAFDTESMDLLEASEEGRILFAASSIISASVPWKVDDEFALWNSFLVNFASDFGDNGKIDNINLRSLLYAAAFYVKNNISRIEEGVNNKFSDEFFDFEIPEFEDYIDQSLLASAYAGEMDGLVNRLFPEMTGDAINILNLPQHTVLHPDSTYVLHFEPFPSDVDYFLTLEVHADTFNGTLDFDDEPWNDFYFENDIKWAILEITNETTEGFTIPVHFSGSGRIDTHIILNINHVNEFRDTSLTW